MGCVALIRELFDKYKYLSCSPLQSVFQECFCIIGRKTNYKLFHLLVRSSEGTENYFSNTLSNSGLGYVVYEIGKAIYLSSSKRTKVLTLQVFRIRLFFTSYIIKPCR